jgi:hypothetical protein
MGKHPHHEEAPALGASPIESIILFTQDVLAGAASW